jgi:hypothetical protein
MSSCYTYLDNNDNKEEHTRSTLMQEFFNPLVQLVESVGEGTCGYRGLTA